MENRVFNFACVFCGSRTGTVEAYQQGAASLGRELLQRKIGLVYGGGTIGLMGIIANAVSSGTRHFITSYYHN